jgi:hypothetical protein
MSILVVSEYDSRAAVFPLKTAVRENGNCSSRIYGKRQKAEGRRQKVYFWYVVVSAVRSVLTY